MVAYSTRIVSAGCVIVDGSRGIISTHLPNVLCNETSFGSESVLLSSDFNVDVISCGDMEGENGDDFAEVAGGDFFMLVLCEVCAKEDFG